MGRPPRTVDEDLTIQIQSLVTRVGSLRKVAISLGIEPSTLSRSVSRRAFSRATKRRIVENWGSAIDPLTNSKMPHGDSASREKMLHLMITLNSALSTAIAELEASRGKS